MKINNGFSLFSVVLIVVLSLSGCGTAGLTISDIPLPASGDLSGRTIKATFPNALNLPDQAKVKFNGNDVGQVNKISVKNYVAQVEMSVRDSIKLPVGTGAELRQATPLGDVFVALIPPKETPSSYMKPGDTLTGKTGAAATVEDLLVTATAFVDGGSVASLTQVIHELSLATGDRSKEITELIQGITTSVRRLNLNTAEIDKSLNGINSFAQAFSSGRKNITNGISQLSPALAVVNGQIDGIVSLLNNSNVITSALNDFLAKRDYETVSLFDNLASLSTDLLSASKYLPLFADNLEALWPKWYRSTRGNSAAVAGQVFWITPGYGLDSKVRLPDSRELIKGAHSLEQTLGRILARLTGTKGCCKK